MITEIYAYEEAPSTYSASIFLVGPTPREGDITSWRPEALTAIANAYKETGSELDLVIFIPEPRDQMTYHYREQVEWEKQHLDLADILFTWVPRDLKTSLKGLTTNIEFGKYVESGKLFYGRPDNADNIDYLDWLYTKATTRQPTNTLTALTKEVLTYLNTTLTRGPSSIRMRTAGERYVPLNIWSTLQFQAWYQTQRQAGNHLVDAQVLWSFIIHRVNLVFSYALHVRVWIAAEHRIKSNEFILTRPDISVVVPYWKHPTNLFDSEIVLVKEFRAPARTADGFVHELPGGSSFSGQENSLVLASNELREETSLKINSERFRDLGAKQLVATWSTHYAQAYAVELTAAEMAYAKDLARSGKTFGVAADTEHTYVEVCTLKDVGKYVDWSMEGMIYRAIFDTSS